MKIEYHNEYSYFLNRNMEFKVFGHAGKPCLAFPTQDNRFYELEDRGIINSISYYIDNGMIQVFCVDGIDSESWSAKWMRPYDRIRHQEAYYNYIINELVPRIFEINTYGNGGGKATGIMTFGCSIGAYQSMNFFLRRPDIFDMVLSLSGLFHSGYFIENYSDELTFLNSPIDSLSHLDYNHYYVNLYKKAKIIVCVGQGAYESECINDTKALEYQFRRLNIDAWFDYWGCEYMHDWPSWLKMAPHFLYHLLK